MLYGRKPIGTIGYLGGLMALPEEFCWSWGQMIQYNSEYLADIGTYVHLTRAKISYHAAARNSLVDQMDGEWLLQLDTDHSFPPDIAARMLHQMDHNGIDVLTGLYVSKAIPHAPILYTWTDDEKPRLEQIAGWGGDSAMSIFQIGSAGGGNLMVRRSVFDRIQKELKEGPFDITPPFGEDHSFFLRLRKLGIKAYCAPGIRTDHLAIRGSSIDDFDPDYIDMKTKKPVGAYR